MSLYDVEDTSASARAAERQIDHGDDETPDAAELEDIRRSVG